VEAGRSWSSGGGGGGAAAAVAIVSGGCRGTAGRMTGNVDGGAGTTSPRIRPELHASWCSIKLSTLQIKHTLLSVLSTAAVSSG
jgi:hypothetical protein